MSIDTNHMLFLDLETTGSSADSDIIEVGIALYTVAGVEVDAMSAVVAPRQPRRLLTMDDVVVNMHTRNGLIADLISGVPKTIQQAEAAILDFLRDREFDRNALIPLAGSGVSHFDRQFIRRDWPQVDRRLTYWAYDVGPIRRALQLAGVPSIPEWESGVTHRALDDARAHAKEFFGYQQMFKERLVAGT